MRRHMRAAPVPSDDKKGSVIEQLVEIGDQLAAATRALHSLVEELRSDLSPDISEKG